MSDSSSSGSSVERRKPLTSFQILSYFVLAFAAFAGRSSAFFDGPKTFTQVLVIGLSNGALYALIALGYTMVYGIIELINFAHGDLFMIGSVLAAIFIEERLNSDEVLRRKPGCCSLVVMIVVMASVR